MIVTMRGRTYLRRPELELYCWLQASSPMAYCVLPIFVSIFRQITYDDLVISVDLRSCVC